jgi:hypothetical protein
MYEKAKADLTAEAYRRARADIGAEAISSSYKLIRAVDPRETHESLWYAPYNALLNAHFPSSAGFAIAPQWETGDPRGSIDYVIHGPFVTYVIEFKMRPIFFVEIKPDYHYAKPWARADADAQMRRRLDVLSADSPVTTLYGLSFLGGHFAVYKSDTATNKHTPKMRNRTSRCSDVAPQNWWRYDILSTEGKKYFDRVIDRVKTQASVTRKSMRDSSNRRLESPLTDYDYDSESSDPQQASAEVEAVEMSDNDVLSSDGGEASAGAGAVGISE